MTPQHTEYPPYSSSYHFIFPFLSLSLLLPVHFSFPCFQWWDRVFTEDEPIETSCCSVGGDVSQLPIEARERAQRESNRFEGLSEEARGLEMAAMAKAKKVQHSITYLIVYLTAGISFHVISCHDSESHKHYA
jgi:hypothetical protein